MLIVIADTGAAVSLALSGLLDVCRSQFRIIIGEKITEELKEISTTANDELSKAAREVLKEMEIMPTGKNFEKGEYEALELLEKTKADILISDDIEFVKKNRITKR